MAFLITHFWPGATAEQYAATVAAIHPEGGLPPGQTHHAGGPTEGGILISATWDSKELFESFMAETLLRRSARAAHRRSDLHRERLGADQDAGRGRRPSIARSIMRSIWSFSTFGVLAI